MKSIKMLMMAALTILSVSVFAQDTSMHKIKMHKQKSMYSCPMHPEMVMDKPGKCSKCGMDLTKSNKEHMKMDAMKIYTCPMHADVTSDKPGPCSKCGMNLKETGKSQTTNSYCCPMHADITSDKPGKCPKCNMDLTKSKKEHMKMDAMKMYTCPMHADVTGDKPGKCPKCNMDLKEVETTNSYRLRKHQPAASTAQ